MANGDGRLALVAGNRANVARIAALPAFRIVAADVSRPLPRGPAAQRQPGIGRAQVVLGWRSRVPPHVALASTMAWCRNQILARLVRPRLRPYPTMVVVGPAAS